MPVTYGSIGDIIATVQIAHQLLQALNASRGSAREYQELVLLLRTFHGALEQLILFFPTRTECPQLETLYTIIHPFTIQCRDEMSSTLERIIVKYGNSLSTASAGSRVKKGMKDMGKMIQWHLFESDTIVKLKDKLRTCCEVISMVQMRAQGIAEEKDSTIIAEKMDALFRIEEEIDAKLEQRLGDLENKFEEQTEILISAISPIEAITLDMREIVLDIRKQTAMNQTIPRALNQYQDAVQLEDALGYILPIPLETIRSWEAIKAILNDHFCDRPGGELVRMDRYVFQDAANGRDLDVKIPFMMSTRPGLRLKMAMIFYGDEGFAETTTVCPGCKTIIISASNSVEAECINPNCKMEFLRVKEEFSIMDVQPGDSDGAALCRCDEHDEYQTEGHHIENDVPNQLLEQRCSEDGPEVFKRVRYITRWQDMLESRSHGSLDLGVAKFWMLTGVAESVRNQLGDFIIDTFKVRWRDIYLGAPFVPGRFLVGFIGKSIQQSSPIIILSHEDKRIGQRAWKVTSTKTCLRQSGIAVATCSAATFKNYLVQVYSRLRDEERSKPMLQVMKP